MFKDLLAQVRYDKAVWEENEFNDEIFHCCTAVAVLQMNYLYGNLHAFKQQEICWKLLGFSCCLFQIHFLKTNITMV